MDFSIPSKKPFRPKGEEQEVLNFISHLPPGMQADATCGRETFQDLIISVSLKKKGIKFSKDLALSKSL
jgi:hypothetical protein